MSIFSKLRIGRDDSGYVTNEIPWPKVEQSSKIGLEARTPASITVPESAYHVRFIPASGGVVWCGYGDSSLAPATVGIFTNEASELVPIARPVFDPLGERISTLQFLSENDTFLNVIFYGKYEGEISK
ncbi:hypothetical protein [uncultured Paraglaciecola sp.]|uniref:hypothetical protein n=1 Tax=uncultured Paraglaciecola sp. TaxID=1765024 RepID=UPI002634DBE9|nr:hypothetical protein [uncultured Paraglaciecola sp.]